MNPNNWRWLKTPKRAPAGAIACWWMVSMGKIRSRWIYAKSVDAVVSQIQHEIPGSELVERRDRLHPASGKKTGSEILLRIGRRHFRLFVTA